MESDKEKKRNLTSLILALIAGIITLVSFFTQEEASSQTYILFGIIVIIVFLGLGAISIINKWSDMNKRISNNSTEVDEIQKSLNTHKLYNDMDKRMQVLEKLFDKLVIPKNKKGQGIDPRILFWIILIILLILFLKSIGVF